MLLFVVVSFVAVASAAVVVAASASASSFTAHVVAVVFVSCCNRFDIVPNVRRHTCDVSIKTPHFVAVSFVQNRVAFWAVDGCLLILSGCLVRCLVR